MNIRVCKSTTIAILIAAMLFCFTGCDTDSTQPSPTVPSEYNMNSTMYFTAFDSTDGHIITSYETEVSWSIAENPDDTCSLDLTISLSDGSLYDFAEPDNHFEVQHLERDLPYYCAKAWIYMPAIDGFTFYNFAVDPKNEYLIFEPSDIPTVPYYVVASSDPTADPAEIADYFSGFFEAYDRSYLFDEE